MEKSKDKNENRIQRERISPIDDIFIIYDYLKENRGVKQFVMRMLVLLLIVMLIIPGIIGFIVKYFDFITVYTPNYLYTSLLMLTILGLFVLHALKKIKKIKPYKQNIAQTLIFGYVALLFYGAYFYFKYYMNISTLTQYAQGFLMLEFVLTLMAIIFMAFAVLNKHAFEYLKSEIIIAFSAALISFVLIVVIRNSWHFFSTTLTKCSAGILSWIYPDVYYTLEGDPQLYVQGFTAAIGAPCSGIDSLSMFIGLFILMIFLDWRYINKNRIPAFFMIGLVGMFFMSILRIFLLFYVGTFNPGLAMSLFHTNLGWVFFIAYFMIFLWFIYPWMRTKKIKDNKNKGK